MSTSNGSPAAAAAISLRDHCVRPGVDLAWGPGPPMDATSHDDVAVRFRFILGDDATRAGDRMFAACSGAPSACDCAGAACGFSVTIAFSSAALEELLQDDKAPGAAPLRACLGGPGTSGPLPLTPAARLAVDSIRRCPFTGTFRAMALTSRCNDLVLEFLGALAALEETRPAPLLRAMQDQVRAAAGVLAAHLDDPPSLLALARQVGLSETTLKRGFHQVFDTTVFGYLRARRMERARALLEAGEATVLEAAALVGYSNPSNFAAAFRRQFGVNPKAFQLTARR